MIPRGSGENKEYSGRVIREVLKDWTRSCTAKRRIRREKRRMRLINAEKLMKDVEKDFCYPEAYKKMIEA